MIKQFQAIIALLITASTFLSCTSDEEKDSAFKFVDLEYYETFNQEGTEINFHFSTVETFPCSNFTLQLQLNSSARHTDIEISDIEVPDVCVTAIGPAMHTLVLGNTENVTEDFTIWINEHKHNFRLEINQENIIVHKESPFENHLLFAFDSLMRIPHGTVWGYVLIDAATDKNEIYDALMDAFFAVGAEEMVLPDGNYYYFNIQDDQIHFDNVKQQNFPFYFRFDPSLDTLIETYYEVIDKYEDHEIQLRLFNTTGERFVM